jgi:hypothetical protein
MSATNNKRDSTTVSAVTDSNKKPKPSPFAKKKKPEKLNMDGEVTNSPAPPLRNTATQALVNPKSNSISYICLQTPDVDAMQKDDEGNITVQKPGIVLLLGHNYTERLLTQPYYMRNPGTRGHSPLYLDFIEVMGCHPKVYKVCDPRTDGKQYLLRQYQDKLSPGQFKSTNCQVIAIGIPNGATWDNCLKEFHTDTVVPAINLLQTSPICRVVPVIGANDDPVYYIDRLSKCLVDDDICELVTALHASHDDDEDGPKDLEEFFKKAKGNLYMCWPPGEVPLKVIKACKLGQEHLDEKDYERLHASLPSEE